MIEKVEIGKATLYHGDALELLPFLQGVDAVIADPPYGINYAVSARNWQNDGLDALKPWRMEKQAPIKGDDLPFDPAPFLFAAKVALFGANHFASRLPSIDGRWIVWDKRRDSKPDDHSDCEFVWTNRKGADRIHRQKWRGIVREGEENCSRSRKLHSNQKPVALLDFIVTQLDLQPGQTILDPFMGSGSMAIVAHRRDMNFIGIEIERKHFDTACARIEAEQMKGRLAI